MMPTTMPIQMPMPIPIPIPIPVPMRMQSTDTTTTSNYDRKKKKKKNLSVRFNKVINIKECLHIKDYTLGEAKSTWYTYNETFDRKQEILQTMNVLVSTSSSSSPSSALSSSFTYPRNNENENENANENENTAKNITNHNGTNTQEQRKRRRLLNGLGGEGNEHTVPMRVEGICGTHHDALHVKNTNNSMTEMNVYNSSSSSSYLSSSSSPYSSKRDKDDAMMISFRGLEERTVEGNYKRTMIRQQARCVVFLQQTIHRQHLQKQFMELQMKQRRRLCQRQRQQQAADVVVATDTMKNTTTNDCYDDDDSDDIDAIIASSVNMMEESIADAYRLITRQSIEEAHRRGKMDAMEVQAMHWKERMDQIISFQSHRYIIHKTILQNTATAIRTSNAMICRRSHPHARLQQQQLQPALVATTTTTTTLPQQCACCTVRT